MTVKKENSLTYLGASDGLPIYPPIKAYPKGGGKRRWVFLFHVIGVQK